MLSFAAAVEHATTARTLPLPRLGDWLVLAAWRRLLRTRLLLPTESEAGQAAQREAEALQREVSS